jgi:hypothetical protein
VAEAAVDEARVQINRRLTQNRVAGLIPSMPGFEPALAAIFLAQIGGNLEAFDSSVERASASGLAPGIMAPLASVSACTDCDDSTRAG